MCSCSTPLAALTPSHLRSPSVPCVACGSNEEFLDLLAPGGSAKLRLVEDATDPSAFMQVDGALELTAASADDLLQRVAAGAELRASSATNMNDASSRSHAVLMLKVVAAGAAPAAKGTVFSIVDLAGSERVNRSGVQGAKFDEAVSINASLSALARVVSALVEQGGKRAKFIPYRDSKLTHLLKNGAQAPSTTPQTTRRLRPTWHPILPRALRSQGWAATARQRSSAASRRRTTRSTRHCARSSLR